MVLVAFQGEAGSYSEEAMQGYFRARGMRNAESLPCDDFEDAVRRVESGEAHYAFLPIENTMEGTVDGALDVLLQSDLVIVGEMRHHVEHCLIGHPGATVESVEAVYSHPYAIRQCRDFLRVHGLRAVPTHDTAGAVREVKARGNLLEAAIAGATAADLHGMKVLQKGIQSRQHNYTRFVACSKNEYKTRRDGRESFMTTLVFGCRDTPSALHDVLGAFAERSINLTKLESRPRLDRPWTYSFLVDFEGHREDPDVAAALSDLLNRTTQMQILGSYPTWDSVAAAEASNGAAEGKPSRKAPVA